MRMACFVALALAAGGCSDGGRRVGDDGGEIDGGGSDDGGVDAPPAPCDDDSDCDDGFDCTVDRCAVEGRCEHTPIDERCEAGQSCVVGTGCSSGCTDDSDCDDGNYCNGAEECLPGAQMCRSGSPRDCDDGNDCTIDTCDEEMDGCTYEIAPGCDGGTATMDAGPPPDFDPTMHYQGTFTVVPSQGLGCSSASYSFSEVTFSTSGGELRVMADWIQLTQSPVPDGPSFDVRATNGSCSEYRLQGTFTNANEFDGTWTATMLSACSFCTNVNESLVGVRSD